VPFAYGTPQEYRVPARDSGQTSTSLRTGKGGRVTRQDWVALLLFVLPLVCAITIIYLF
jgi:hypothetical protein